MFYTYFYLYIKDAFRISIYTPSILIFISLLIFHLQFIKSYFKTNNCLTYFQWKQAYFYFLSFKFLIKYNITFTFIIQLFYLPSVNNYHYYTSQFHLSPTRTLIFSLGKESQILNTRRKDKFIAGKKKTKINFQTKFQ